MADSRHGSISIESGRHPVIMFEYANATDRINHVPSRAPDDHAGLLLPFHIGAFVIQTDDETFYILVNDSPITWKSGQDADAIHKSIPAEISTLPVKATPVAGDLLVIEDGAAGFAKKGVDLSTLPSPAHTHVEADISDLEHTHDTAGKIAAVTTKATLVAADVLLINDSEAGDAVKSAPLSALPDNSFANGAVMLVRNSQYSLSTSPNQVLYDTADVIDTAYYTFEGNGITFVQAGTYHLTAEFTGDIISGSATSLNTIQMYEDVGAGFVAIVVAIAEARSHYTTVTEQHPVATVVREFAVGDKLRVYTWKASGTANSVSVPAHNRLNIVALKE